MALIKCIITLVLMALGVCAIAQVKSGRRKVYIIDGFFFHRLPVDEKSIIAKVNIATSDNRQAVAIFTDIPLNDFQIQSALPSALIPQSDALLRQYYSVRQAFNPPQEP